MVTFTLEQATKAQREADYSSTLSLTSALDRVGWSTPRPGRFPPGEDPIPIAYNSFTILKQTHAFSYLSGFLTSRTGCVLQLYNS